MQVEAAIRSAAEQDGIGCRISIPQDPGQAGKAQVAGLSRLLHGFDVRFSPETGSKEARAVPFAAQVEVGNVHLVKGSWNDPYLNEFASFPTGEFKDQVDASTRAYHQLIVGGIGSIPAGPIVAIDYGGDGYRPPHLGGYY
jgi:predicted phage terminase large subunit-like protein